MKARKLKVLLNNTDYTIHDGGEVIKIGSLYISDLITVNKETKEIKYKLDTFNKGRKTINNEELLFIWDKLHEIVNTDEFQDIIDNYDFIEEDKRIPVFTYKDGKIIESYTDKIGYPNKTYDGKLMYDNTYFDSPEKAKEKAIKEYESTIEYMSETIQNKKEEIEKMTGKLNKYKNYLIT